MANVRLLRQQVQDYQRELMAVNRDYRADYNQYKEAVDSYNTAVAARNTQIANAQKNGTNLAEPINGGSSYKVLSGVNAGREVPLVTSLNKNVGDYVFKHNGSGGLTLYKLQNVSWSQKGYVGVATVGKATALPASPVAPEEPDAPPGPSFTEKEKKLLTNPTAGPAEMNMGNAKGVSLQSSLAGEVPTASTSPFANPEDPNNLKEKGVLARVLGGQL